MIPQVELGCGLRTSRLAFGTSRLHYLGSRERQRILAAAADLGLLHFDTAPSYGDGLAEYELGKFLRGRRSRIVAATKYGIPPNPVSAALPSLAVPVLALRAIARRIGLDNANWPPITASGLRYSVEHSLRRLGTDHIDILFLHEPAAARVPQPDAILDELLKLRQRGLIRHFGLAGALDGVAEIIKARPEVGEVLQTKESEWASHSPPDITYGVISNAPQSFGGAQVDAQKALDALRAALQRRPRGVVVVSTRKEDHLRELVTAVEG
jgi:aryl-alcohol dehydrogenase-like predicted oxidoreductase